MTAIMMAAAGNTVPSGGIALDTTVTVGSGFWTSISSVTSYFGYGYALGVDYLGLGNFGSIGSATYTDGGSNSRTISAIYYTDGALGDSDDLFFCLNATSIGNTDATFVSIDYNGTNYTRASATYTATTGSCSTWRWLNITPNGPVSGTPALVVNI